MAGTKSASILITGGAGFLGINLVRYLLRKGYRNIAILDIADFCYPERESIVCHQEDIRRRQSISRCLQGVDFVIHAAAALPLYTKHDIYSTDVEGTRNLLEAATATGVKRFVHISSTAVYGIPHHHPIREDDPLIGVGFYGQAKILAEQACEQYRSRDLCIPILRPKSFIGPERLGVFALLYDWAREGRGFPMIGRGNNRYQLLDVEDLCEAIHLCLLNDEKTANDTFNIGAKEFTTMREDFQAVLDAAAFRKRIVALPAGPAIAALKVLERLGLSPLYKWVYETAGKDSFVSIQKAEEQLGFSPRYSNQEALVRNFRWYLDNVESFSGQSGITHRTPWNQGILKIAKLLF